MVAAPRTSSALRIPAQGRLSSVDAEAMRELLVRQPATGTWNSDLEAAVSRLSGARHVVAAAGLNTALSLLLRAIDLEPDDEVIVPANASASIADVILSRGGCPVPVDVQSDSLHIDPMLMAQAVTERTKAVVAIGAGGIAIDAEPLLNLTRSPGILLIEGVCGLPVRPHAPVPGQVRCFATGAHGGNASNSGALIAVENVEIAERLRCLVHGKSSDSDASDSLHMAEGMTEVAAAWQLALLPRLRDDWLRRYELAMNYSAAFSSRMETEEPTEPVDARPGWHDYALRLNLHHLAVSRDDLARRLQRRGVPAAVRWLPVILSPVLQHRLGLSPENYPVTRNEFLRELSLPLHASLTDGEVECVIDTVCSELDAIASRDSGPRPRSRP